MTKEDKLHQCNMVPRQIYEFGNKYIIVVRLSCDSIDDIDCNNQEYVVSEEGIDLWVQKHKDILETTLNGED